MQMKKMNNKGFTLIELLAVLVILVVIMSIAIPSITSSAERSKAKQREQVINIVKAQAELYADKAESVEEAIAAMSSGNSKIDLSLGNDGTPNPIVHDFIPLTTYDFVYKDKIGNPYDSVKDKVYLKILDRTGSFRCWLINDSDCLHYRDVHTIFDMRDEDSFEKIF